MRIAIVGSGISGLSCAWLLGQRHDVTVYEGEPRLGGHSHTVDMPWQGGSVPVDTGFIVYNERNYPNLTRLFHHLAVPTRPSDMSFAVSIDGGRLEYSGSSLGTLFAQKRNLIRLSHHSMLFDIVRFNRDAKQFLAVDDRGSTTLARFLDHGRYGVAFRDHYLLPMAAAIWSSSLEAMGDMPAGRFLRFFDNHGLLSIDDRPEWRTVSGGSRVYVDKLAAGLDFRVRLGTPVTALRRSGTGVEVRDGQGGSDRFDQVVLGCHADQALRMIEEPRPAERSILGAFRYQTNRAVLHRDPALMPRRRSVWSSWNHLSAKGQSKTAPASTTYWLNRLQGIDPECLALLSLNPPFEPAADRVVAEYRYEHPQLDGPAMAAQARLTEIQGRDGIWFCGAHWGYGFHEDGLVSGLRVATALGVSPPWWPRVEPLRGATAWTMPERAAAGPA
jgi:predicted NAD/FAD-binding protein